MINKKYLVTLLLLTAVVSVLLDIKSPSQSISDTTSHNTIPLAEVKKIAPQQEIVPQKINPYDINELDKTKTEISKETKADDKDTELSEAELADTNADMPATGEFADQVNLAIENSDCTESCVDNLDVTIPAEGEFADQINADAILAQATLKNPELQTEAKLTDVSANSHPSTEFGVYTPPPQ